jgi:Zn-dependent M16 (insulinase) family peptidase
VYYCVQPTNGLTYFNGISSITLVADEVKPYLPLFCHVITKYVSSMPNELYQVKKPHALTVVFHVCFHHQNGCRQYGSPAHGSVD